MGIGKKIRMKRIFGGDGRSLVVAIDHAAIIGPKGNIAKPKRLMEELSRGKPDALLLTKGMLREGQGIIDPCIATILRISGGFTMLGNPADFQDRVISSVEQAVKYGADGVAITVKYGHANEGEFIEKASRVADDCNDWGMPLMIEVWPAGPNVATPSEPKAVTLGSRAAAEIGADIVKTYYTGDKTSFAEVVSGCPIPVVVLGGEQKTSIRDFFAAISESLEAGAAGVAVGRNIWGHKSPAAITEAVRGLIHLGWDIDKAVAHLGE